MDDGDCWSAVGLTGFFGTLLCLRSTCWTEWRWSCLPTRPCRSRSEWRWWPQPLPSRTAQRPRCERLRAANIARHNNRKQAPRRHPRPSPLFFQWRFPLARLSIMCGAPPPGREGEGGHGDSRHGDRRGAGAVAGRSHQQGAGVLRPPLSESVALSSCLDTSFLVFLLPASGGAALLPPLSAFLLLADDASCPCPGEVPCEGGDAVGGPRTPSGHLCDQGADPGPHAAFSNGDHWR